MPLKFEKDLPPLFGNKEKIDFGAIVSDLKRNKGKWALIETFGSGQNGWYWRRELQNRGAIVRGRKVPNGFELWASWQGA